MKTIMNTSMQKTVSRVLRPMAVDALLGATSGGLFGLIFGGFGASSHGESWRLVTMAWHFALFGAVAGALVGACRAIFHSEESTSESTDRPREGGGGKPTPVAGDGQPVASSHPQSHETLVVAVSSDRRRMPTIAAKHPLSC